MYQFRSTFICTALACALLASCSSDSIDYRQIDFNNGLAYKHGSTEPFTGVILFKDSIPGDIGSYWNSNAPHADGTSYEQVLNSCSVHFNTGAVDGETTCISIGGKTALTLTYRNEKFDGVSKIYNPDSGKLIKELNWASGSLNGVDKIYTLDGNQLIQEVQWRNGAQDGPVKVWDASGKLLTSLIYTNGKVKSGTVIDASGSREFKDGELDGPATLTLQDGKAIESKGVYSVGQRVGEWQDWNGSAYTLVINWSTSTLVSAFSELPGDFGSVPPEAVHIKSNWSNGKLNGDVQGYDKAGKLIFAFQAKDDVLDGSFEYISNSTNEMRTFTFENNHPVAVSNSNTAASPQTENQNSGAIENKTMPQIDNKMTTQEIIDAGGIGELTVMSKNTDGYPIFLLECEQDGKCVGDQGQPIGDIKSVAAEMPPVKTEDAATHKYVCNVLCRDTQGNVVGSAP